MHGGQSRSPGNLYNYKSTWNTSLYPGLPFLGSLGSQSLNTVHTVWQRCVTKPVCMLRVYGGTYMEGRTMFVR